MPNEQLHTINIGTGLALCYNKAINHRSYFETKMDINDQLDENAADLRNIPAGSPGAEASGVGQSPQEALPSPPVSVGVSKRSISPGMAVLVCVATAGLAALVYFWLQKQSVPPPKHELALPPVSLPALSR